jgi:hypothetical protein
MRIRKGVLGHEIVIVRPDLAFFVYGGDAENVRGVECEPVTGDGKPLINWEYYDADDDIHISFIHPVSKAKELYIMKRFEIMVIS